MNDTSLIMAVFLVQLLILFLFARIGRLIQDFEIHKKQNERI